MPSCQATIQQGARKGEQCHHETDSTYCSKHSRQAIVENAAKNNKRLCDIARGCYTVLEDHQVKCTHCLHKARISDRKRNDQKRQDSTLCLDCGSTLTESTRAKGKHDKSLRRCVPCYEKLLKYESQRPPRERIYKAEAFVNKHVLWNHYVKGAKKRGLDFTLPKSMFEEMIGKPCFYCTFKKDEEVNGVDRVDNNQGYHAANCVPCCTTCNFLKGTQHPQEFLDKLQAIYRFTIDRLPLLTDLLEKWSTTFPSKRTPLYTTYMKSATSRTIPFTISEAEFTGLIHQSCYLCGVPTSDTNKNGIDRFDNTKGYVFDNCRPCCGHCNLMKKTIVHEVVLEKARLISDRYVFLTDLLSARSIPIRSSKTEPRTKVESPLVQESVPFQYKSVNELIIPTTDISSELLVLLEKPIDTHIPKQWKSKQIYEAIQTDQQLAYKQFCEDHNTIQSIWEQEFTAFTLSVKGKTFEDSEPIIKAFVENLRRIRHNQLCLKPDIVERPYRQIWPSHTIVHAFLEGKLNAFKVFTEAYTAELPENPKWIERWNSFIESLEHNKTDETVLKELCSKFMAAQRIKKYRKSK
jgi:hypothetical protein